MSGPSPREQRAGCDRPFAFSRHIGARTQYASWNDEGKCAAYPIAAGSVLRSVCAGDGNQPAPAECGYSTTSAENTETVGVNEAILGSYASVFHQTLTGLGVSHRYCYGMGGHNWKFWPTVFVDFLQYAYGTAPARCPNV